VIRTADLDRFCLHRRVLQVLDQARGGVDEHILRLARACSAMRAAVGRYMSK
jgi:hypothetical protein